MNEKFIINGGNKCISYFFCYGEMIIFRFNHLSLNVASNRATISSEYLQRVKDKVNADTLEKLRSMLSETLGYLSFVFHFYHKQSILTVKVYGWYALFG